MDSIYQILVNKYDVMLEVTKKKETLVKGLPDNEYAIDELKELDKALEQMMVEIDQYNNGLNSLLESERLMLSHTVSEIINKNKLIETQIVNWLQNASGTIKQVNTHRKTLNTYGGANSSDVVSYYFDKKQ